MYVAIFDCLIYFKAHVSSFRRFHNGINIEEHNVPKQVNEKYNTLSSLFSCVPELHTCRPRLYTSHYD